MSKYIKFIGIDRFFKACGMVGEKGGIKGALKHLYRYDGLKSGELVGTDKYGNRYYENNYYFYGRNRWVEYADHVGINYDGSQIPAEWFGWMHYKTDLPPTRDGSRPKYKWMSDHSVNHSGTKYAYMPYSTTRPKIQAWDPNKKPSKPLCGK